MNVIEKDPFARVAVFPLTADLIRPRNGRMEGALQLGRDRVDRSGLDDNPIGGDQGEPGEGVPTGGTDGQVLTKQSSTDYDADWEDPAGGVTYRELTHSISVSGIVPTGSEIDIALAAAYTDPDPDLVPADGDFVILTVSSVPKFVARISTHSITESGSFVRNFTVNSVTYYATLSQCGLY